MTDRVRFRRDADKLARHWAATFATVMTWYIGAWYWGILLTIQVAIGWVTSRFDAVEIETLDGGTGSARFFLFVMGIVVAVSAVPMHIAAGGTRRTWIQGAWWSAAIVGVSFGAVIAAVSRLLGWAEYTLDWPKLVGAWSSGGDGGWSLSATLHGLSCAAYWLTGAAVGMVFYRLGGRGVVVLPALLVPLLVVEFGLQQSRPIRALIQNLGLPEPYGGLALTYGALAFLLAAVAVQIVVRGVALRPVSR